MAIVQRIKETAKERGILLKDLASQLGMSSSTFYRWDDNLPSVDRVVAVAQCLGVSVDYLVGLTDKKTPAATVGDGLDAAILNYVHSLPGDRLRAILIALEAPASVLDALDRAEHQE